VENGEHSLFASGAAREEMKVECRLQDSVPPDPIQFDKINYFGESGDLKNKYPTVVYATMIYENQISYPTSHSLRN